MPEVLQVLHIHNKQPDPSQGVAEMQGRICLGGPTLHTVVINHHTETRAPHNKIALNYPSLPLQEQVEDPRLKTAFSCLFFPLWCF